MSAPIVSVEQGKLKGKIVTHCRGGKYYSFQGIPYGKPPTGELRFKAPLPAEPWHDIRDATTEGNQCFSRHMVFQYVTGSEDCLFLNVYTPELPAKNIAPKSVMVWIHGGGFYAGSGNSEFYSPDFFMSEDVIIVTINYRIGLLGFLNLSDPKLGAPGNAGLKDQVLALKWVQKNISNFNGDPNNVTIFGESAGGASVHYLILSPMAKGLFHRAIVQSGSVFSTWAQGQPSAPLIAEALQLNAVDEKEIMKILQEMPVEKVLEAQEKIPDNLDASKVRPFCPVVEKFLNEDTFLPDEPVNLFKSGSFNKVPLIIGYTSREGMLAEIISKTYHGGLNITESLKNVVPYALTITKGNEVSKSIAQKIKTFYYGDEVPSEQNLNLYYKLQTDALFLAGIHSAIKYHNANSSTPVYLYRVSVESSLNILKRLLHINAPGVCHGEDIGYMFKNGITPDIHPRSIEDNTIRRFTKLWTTFARYGDPNPIKKDPLINIIWKPTQLEQHHFLDIGENLTVGINPEAERMAFWDEICSFKSVVSKL